MTVGIGQRNGDKGIGWKGRNPKNNSFVPIPLSYCPRMKFLSLFLAGVLTAGAQSPDDQARFLSGVGVRDAGLSALTAQKWWQEHSRTFVAAWAKMDRRQLLGVRGWAEAKIPQFHHSSAPVFYFFSGPDFLYAQTFFPSASTYILCGIEPVGAVPDVLSIPRESLPTEINSLRRSLNTMLTTHYFITKDMREDLAHPHLGGTLPLLYIFLCRTGCTIDSVKPLASGVEIKFHSGPGRGQTLYYFKTDLSNGAGNGAFLGFCRGFAPAMSLVKSASYLLHGDGFSTARNFLLQNSRVIVQDDTGIPFRNFAADRWNVHLYGRFVPHGEMFGKYDQPDLAAAFAESPAGALGFSFGYHWQKDRGMIMVAQPR